ncbi:ubiquitin carboxyl-terminal hydrolase 47-like [Gastrophryne carolinensis]
MLPGEDGQPVPREIENAADEPRVLCIIQDVTNSKTINERITLNLPASTTTRQLFHDVAGKVGYVSGTFSLKWGNGASAGDMTELDPSPDHSLLDAGFEAGKKNFLHLTDKNGEQPQLMSDESGTADSSGLDDSTQEKFIGPLPRDGSVGCTSDYISQNYSYSSLLSKSDTGTQPAHAPTIQYSSV